MHFQFLRNSAVLLLALTTASEAATTTKKTTTLKTSTKRTSTVKATTVKSTSSSVLSAPAASSSAPTATIKNIINFGDSYSQTGFNINSTKPSASNPFGNPTFPGYTTSNGNRQNWLGTIITKYNTTLTYAYNFASGGATTDANLVTPYAPYPTVLSLVNQVQEFSATLGASPQAAPWTASNTLFSVWVGVNDVGNGWYQSNWSTLVNQILDQYFKQLSLLYAKGARKFLLLQVPPIYYTPAIIQQGNSTQESVKAAIATYNNLIAQKAAAFKSANAGTTVYTFDPTSAFTTLLQNPTKYGATDATCYSESGTQCLWFNDYHPGQLIHDAVAKGAAAVIGNW